jgi:hypothetical protein
MTVSKSHYVIYCTVNTFKLCTISLNKYIISTINIFIPQSTKGRNEVFKIHAYKNFRDWVTGTCVTWHLCTTKPSGIQIQLHLKHSKQLILPNHHEHHIYNLMLYWQKWLKINLSITILSHMSCQGIFNHKLHLLWKEEYFLSKKTKFFRTVRSHFVEK